MTTRSPSAPHEAVRTHLVPVPVAVDQPPGDPRLSDVDEWGRSEHVREIARRLLEPAYSKWFRVEWEGLEKIPTEGGALLVANHAGAIPIDAPVIMHGIEKELGRARLRAGRLLLPHDPGRGDALGPWRWRSRPARQRLPAPARSPAARPRVPRGRARDLASATRIATGCAASGGEASWRSPCAPGCR